MDIEKVLELRRDWQITLKVVNNVSHPASFAAISEALNLQSEIEAYREARNDYMAHREERRRRIRTAAALAAAEAEVARLRSALQTIFDLASDPDVGDFWHDTEELAASIEDAAYTALNPEATHENG